MRIKADKITKNQSLTLHHKNQEINLQIQTSKKRRTIGIAIYPDLSVKIRAPYNSSLGKIEEIVNEKADWITDKIDHFRHNQSTNIPNKKYIDGEIFYYLGKEYSLKIINSDKNSVQINGGFLEINKASNVKTDFMLRNWFLSKAQEIIIQRFDICFEKFSQFYNYPKPHFKLKRVKSKWGSMTFSKTQIQQLISTPNKLSLHRHNNTDHLKMGVGVMTISCHLIHSSIDCIDYVIMHELCHLKYQNHGKYFHDMESQFTPDWKIRRKELRPLASFIRSL